jgi:DNA-binding CsgD family transcriptional regulator
MVAAELGVAYQTINNHMAHVRKRLGVKTTRAAVEVLLGQRA